MENKYKFLLSYQHNNNYLDMLDNTIDGLIERTTIKFR